MPPKGAGPKAKARAQPKPKAKAKAKALASREVLQRRNDRLKNQLSHARSELRKRDKSLDQAADAMEVMSKATKFSTTKGKVQLAIQVEKWREDIFNLLVGDHGWAPRRAREHADGATFKTRTRANGFAEALSRAVARGPLPPQPPPRDQPTPADYTPKRGRRKPKP